MGLMSGHPGVVQGANPTLTDPNLQVTTVVGGLSQPTCMAFLGPNDFLINEKTSGHVKRVVGGVVTATVLDLPVNAGSERGLLGMALHPNFPDNPGVYLYWTESSTGADSNVLTEVGNPASTFPPARPQPLGNRVDRFIWDATVQTLTYAQNLIRLHAFQHDVNSPTAPRGQPQRRPDPVRSGRQALHPDRRQRPPRLAPEPAQRRRSCLPRPTTSSAAPRRTTTT